MYFLDLYGVYKGIPLWVLSDFHGQNPQNFQKNPTLGELISKLSEYFCFGLFLEQSLWFTVIGKNYAVRRGIPETSENIAIPFSLRILPRPCMDLPGTGDM